LICDVQNDPLQRKSLNRNLWFLRNEVSMNDHARLFQFHQRGADLTGLVTSLEQKSGKRFSGGVHLADSIDDIAADLVQSEDRAAWNEVDKAGVHRFKGMKLPQMVPRCGGNDFCRAHFETSGWS
jgi:hypothetical protein